jgi:hypothetical protein
MASSDRAASGKEDALDTLPRTEAGPEAELEALREWGKHHTQFLNHAVWFDLEEFEARIERTLSLMPKEVRRARRVIREEQRIIEDAKDEARRLLEEARAEGDQILSTAREESERTLTSAREEAERMVESSAIRQRALEQAEATITRAEESARAIREQSYAYAQQVIGNVVTSLKRLTDSVENDRAQLEQNPPDGQGY